MNKKEAATLLEEELRRRRATPYSELRQYVLARHIDVVVVDLKDRSYQMEIQYLWDDESDGAIHVAGAIDDGGWSSLLPLCRSFLKAPDGSIVGE